MSAYQQGFASLSKWACASLGSPTSICPLSYRQDPSASFQVETYSPARVLEHVRP